MQPKCECRSLSTLAGARATSYAHHWLRDVATSDNGRRLLRCRACGADWEWEDELIGDEGERRVRLRRERSAGVVQDWGRYDSDDGS